MSTCFTLTAQSFTGSADRFQQNLDALRVLQELERDQRPATDAEKIILAHFTSFGESALIARLVNRADQVRDLLTADDIAALRRAALTAFYTPLPVVRVLWDALAELGFRNLSSFRMLEPAAGVGNIISAMPPDLRARAHITAVELEPLSARILGHIHPDITLFHDGFQDAELADSSFDLIISNVPFGDFGVADQSITARFLKARIHDYFFAKAMRLVRPGGIIAFLTSYGTLDKQDERVRQWLSDRAELLGAYRLPCGIFAENAGSQAGTDLLILRRYLPDAQPQPATWIDLDDVQLPTATGRVHATTGSRYGDVTDPVRVNAYFARNPEQVIGTAYEVRRNGFLFYVVQPPADDLANALQQRLTVTLPLDVVQPFVAVAPLSATPRPATLEELADPDLTQVSVGQRQRATALAAVYAAAKDLIRKETDPATPDATLEAARHHLNAVYDEFVAVYGILSAPDTRRLFRHLPEMAFLLALETNARRHGTTWQAEKAAIFTRRTLRAAAPEVDGQCSVQDALIRSLDRTGRVDLPLIGRLSGQDQETVLHDLQDVIFRVPDLATERYETADAYLSGDVRAKLRAARAVAALNPAFQVNVDALEAVLPDPLGADEIIVRLGAVWLPEDVIHSFLTHLIPSFGAHDGVRFFPHDASWRIAATYTPQYAVENTDRWGTARRSAIDLVQLLLNSSPIIVSDTIKNGDTTTTVVNDAETAAAQEKAQAIREAFAAWIWADDARRDRLVDIYNDRFNAIRSRNYDGRHLSLPGLNTAVLRGGDLSEWQKGAVWQILQNRATLLAHCVGAGKTFTMVAAAREARRMGLANKPVLVVPNHLVGQTAREALRLFPALKLLALGSEDFSKERRGIVLSRIATGDWDLVIIAMTSLQFLPVDASVLTQFHTLERSRLRDALESAQADMERASDRGEERKAKRGIKKIEKALERLDARVDDALQRMRRDSERTVTWRELGIDLLMIDEAHNYKNLYVPSRLQVAGAPQGDSLRALDLRIKTWDLLQQGQKVVFATATPIMNSLAEAYVMQLYLQEEELRAQGLDTFDAWVSVYAEVRDMFELKPDSSGFQVKSRLNTFINLPELSMFWRTVMNVRTAEQLELPRPALVGNGAMVVSVPQSRAQQRMIDQFARRVDAIKKGAVDPREDNMLKVTSEGRLLALDQRLILGGPETPRSKINALVARVAASYHAYAAAKGTQLIFCDLATPKGRATATDAQTDPPPAEDAAETSLNNRVYHEIREKLARQGIPAHEVAFIHDYPTKAKRDELFEAVNAGTVRVLIGSTSKMGTGMNVQRRAIALHHLDAPWRPGDVEQRDGRILRQGNMWKEVYLFHYVTEGSFDAYIWQLLENKARFIGQVITGEVTARSADDVGDVVLTAAEVKAIASGNPLILQRFKIENEVAKLDRVQRTWRDSRWQMERRIERINHDRATRAVEIAELEAANAVYQTHRETPFALTCETQVGDVAQVTWTKREDAGAALLRLAKQYRAAAAFQRQLIQRTIGSYRGAAIEVKAPASDLFPTSLRLVYMVDGTPVRVYRHYLETDGSGLTPHGLTMSMDAAVRGMGDTITRTTELNHQNAATIAALKDELARTATWEQQARYDALRADFARITAELNAASAAADALRDAPTAPDAADAHAAATDVVSDAAIAAALAAQDEIDPACAAAEPWTLPAAPANLAVLDDLIRATAPDAAVEGTGDLDAEVVDVEAADAEPVGEPVIAPVITPAAPAAPTRPRPIRPRPTFGDLSALSPAPRRAARAQPATAGRWDTDTSDLTQLPLFASAPVTSATIQPMAAPHVSQQLTLL